MSDLLIEKREDNNNRTERLTIPKLQDIVYFNIGSTLKKKKATDTNMLQEISIQNMHLLIYLL
jgi:hypothetical protein